MQEASCFCHFWSVSQQLSCLHQSSSSLTQPDLLTQICTCSWQQSSLWARYGHPSLAWIVSTPGVSARALRRAGFDRPLLRHQDCVSDQAFLSYFQSFDPSVVYSGCFLRDCSLLLWLRMCRLIQHSSSRGWMSGRRCFDRAIGLIY